MPLPISPPAVSDALSTCFPTFLFIYFFSLRRIVSVSACLCLCVCVSRCVCVGICVWAVCVWVCAWLSTGQFLITLVGCQPDRPNIYSKVRHPAALAFTPAAHHQILWSHSNTQTFKHSRARTAINECRAPFMRPYSGGTIPPFYSCPIKWVAFGTFDTEKSKCCAT